MQISQQGSADAGRGSGAYAVADIVMAAGEAIHVERDAVQTMSDGITVRAGVGSAGPVKALWRTTFGQETFFTGRYTADVTNAWITVAPTMPGDIVRRDMTPGQDLMLTAGSFVASAESVTLDTTFGGPRSVLMREGLAVLRVSGQGPLLFATYGGMRHLRLASGQRIFVDTGHAVAWSAEMEPQVGLPSGLMTSALTGKGLYIAFTGPGDVFVQTRSAQSLRSWWRPRRKHDGR